MPLIFHANGGTGKLLQMTPLSSDVLGLDWNTEMREARALYGPKRVLQVRAQQQRTFPLVFAKLPARVNFELYWFRGVSGSKRS